MLGWWLVSGCAQPRVTQRAAVDAANRAAAAAGYRLGDYRRPKALFVRPCGGDHKQWWWISYDPRVELRATNTLGITCDRLSEAEPRARGREIISVLM